MSTNFLRRTAIQSSFTRQPIFRSANTRSFHTTLSRMTVHNIQTADAFKAAVKDNKVVMLDCFATWCGPCKAIAPILANHSNDEQFKDIFFAKIDVDDLPELSQELGITAMPTFMIFKDGNEAPAEKLVGADLSKLELIPRGRTESDSVERI
ncbi:thioredoxin [Xylariomycetidae sp. FL2044]|nr:thioredoxin [Xylariomycetidae sp. FL2044]